VLQEALEREAATREILQVISRSRDNEQPVFDVILDNALRLCEAQFGVLFRNEKGDAFQKLVAQRGGRSQWVEMFEIDPVPLDPEQSTMARAALEKKVMQIEDLSDTDLYRQGQRHRVMSVDEGGMRSVLYVPMVSNDRSVGVIVLYRREVRLFANRDVDLVKTFSAQAAIAIENARQFRELQTRLDREAATREILQVISSSRDDEQPVFDAILDKAAQLCNAPLAFVAMANAERTMLELKGHKGDSFPAFVEFLQEPPLPLDPNESQTARAVIECRTIQIEDLRSGELYERKQPHRIKSVEAGGMRTLLIVPLVRGDLGIGALNLWRPEVSPFSEDEITLVETFAAQAVIAIENVRQFRELQTRLEREAASREILGVISRSRDDERPVFDVILENAARLCDAPMARLHLANAERTHFHLAAAWGDELRSIQPGDHYPLDGTLIVSRTILEARTIHLADLAESQLYLDRNPIAVRLVEEEGIRTRVTVPLVSGDTALGCITLSRREVKPFADADIALVETFAAQAVIAIENVRQFRELQTRLEREAATREILQVIAQSRADEKPVFDAILENATRLCNAPFAYLSMADEERTHVTVPAHLGARSDFAADLDHLRVPIVDSKLALARAIAERKVIRMDDIADDEVYRNRDPNRVAMVEREGARSILVVPLISAGKGIGAITLYRREVAPFSDDDVALGESFAAQATIAVENVKQFKALQARTEEVQALNASLEGRVATQVGELERLGRLKRFLSPQVADAVVSSGDEKLLGSHRALIAVLFCDIRGFTAFCETAEPEETIEVLQTYHEEMGQLINAHGAGVDHRAGDGIMVIFNDPLPCDDPAGDALRMAMAMQGRMAELCKGWRRLGHRLGFGVGISLGYATVGMVGSEGRYDYTASGTAVNLAARLCDEAADGEILLSPRAYAAVEDHFAAESTGEISLKGISAPVEIFRVVTTGAAPG